MLSEFSVFVGFTVRIFAVTRETVSYATYKSFGSVPGELDGDPCYVSSEILKPFNRAVL